MISDAAAAHHRAIDAAVELAQRDFDQLTSGDLAEQAGYSPFHFSRLFTARTGVGPGQFLTALRIAAAKQLLLRDNDPVIDTAAAVGFDSLSSFSRRFKESVGVAPGQLRKLADAVADRPPRPFALVPQIAPSVRVRLEVPESLSTRGDASVWIGWYPHPAPIGLPHAGMLVQGRESVQLPLCPGAPYLLGFAVGAHCDVHDHLAPEQPTIALHPTPLLAPETVTLQFTSAAPGRVPLLSALPILCSHTRSAKS